MENVNVVVPEENSIDVNTASVEVLRDRINGIGQALAERIVAYRDEQGPFTAPSELTRVSGIGPRLLERIADQLVVLPAAEGLGGPVIEAEAVPEAGGEEELGLAEARAPSEEVGVGGLAPEAEAVEPVVIAPEEEIGVEHGGELVETIPEAEEVEPAIEPTRLAEAASPEPAVGQEATAKSQAPPTQAAQAVSVPPPGAAPSAWWHSPLLVLLGGLAGVVLTLVALVIWSGTVDFAPRREVDALSRNVNTMQSNQELAWEQIGHLTLRNEELESTLDGLRGTLDERVGAIEDDLAEAEDDLAETKAVLASLSGEVEGLRTEVNLSLGEMGQRVDDVEETASDLTASLAGLEEGFRAVETLVARFDTFFDSLRDLLIEMQGTREVAP